VKRNISLVITIKANLIHMIGCEVLTRIIRVNPIIDMGIKRLTTIRRNL
jgi:hypothetical protein